MYFRRVSQMLSCPLLHFVFLSSLKVGTVPHIQKLLEETKLDFCWFNLTFLWKYASWLRQNFLKEVQNFSSEKTGLCVDTLFQSIQHCDITWRETRAPQKISERSAGIFSNTISCKGWPLFELKFSNISAQCVIESEFVITVNAKNIKYGE
jgi:hypothetical protein